MKISGFLRQSAICCVFFHPHTLKCFESEDFFETFRIAYWSVRSSLFPPHAMEPHDKSITADRTAQSNNLLQDLIGENLCMSLGGARLPQTFWTLPLDFPRSNRTSPDLGSLTLSDDLQRGPEELKVWKHLG